MGVISKISSRTLYVVINKFHRRVYFILIVSFYMLVQFFIYFCKSICASFFPFCVPVDSLFRIFWFRKIWNPLLLWSTSEASILRSIVRFSMLIFRVTWIETWIGFLLSLFLSLLLKIIFSWVWYYTITEPWVTKFCSFCISYRIIQIQVINL